MLILLLMSLMKQLSLDCDEFNYHSFSEGEKLRIDLIILLLGERLLS